MDQKKLLEGRYRIVEPIAEGMMGPVFRGLDTESNKPVAIKGLKSELKDKSGDSLQVLVKRPSAGYLVIKIS